MDSHFIPQFYLRAFRDPAILEGQEPWVWVADLKDSVVERKAPKNTGKRANYYVFPNESGVADKGIEQALSRMESAAAPVVRKLLQENFVLSDQERSDLLFFLSFFVTRVPLFRNRVEGLIADVGRKMLLMSAHHPDYFAKTLREAHKGKRNFTPEEIEELRQWTLDDTRYRVRGSLTASLAMGMQLTMETVFPLFNDMKWAFLQSSHPNHFVTSDSPVSWIDPRISNPIYGYGLANKNIEVTFPLGPELCLLDTWEGRTGPVHILPRGVERLNWRRAAFADRYVFANCRELAEVAVRIRSESQPAK